MTKYPFEFNDQTQNANAPSAPPTDGSGQTGQEPPPSSEPENIAAPNDNPIRSEAFLTEEATEPPMPAPAQAEVAALEARLKEREDQLIRLTAEVENMRKRHAQELSNASKFAIESFAETLLPVGDSLEMALQLPNQTLEGLTDGVHITLKQLHQAFEKGRLAVVNPLGEKFDPNRHQAISMVDGKTQDPPVAPGHVVTVMQKGYLIGDRVLRPALVAVAQ
jgi:molecular chaperone GrpE